MFVCAEGLSYRYGDRLLFKNISFILKPGMLLHVVGANGAGKTTLLRIVAGLLTPDDGRIDSQGCEPSDIFYVDHAIAIKSTLTVHENIIYDYHLMGREKKILPTDIVMALQRVGLIAYQHRLANDLSRGQKQRIVLAKLICSTAKLFILDELFTALDTASTGIAERILDEKLQQNAMIIMTRHTSESTLKPGLIQTLKLGDGVDI